MDICRSCVLGYTSIIYVCVGGRFFGISDKGGEIFFSVFWQIMPCIVFPDNSITRKTTFQTNIIGAYMKIMIFWKKTSTFRFGRDNCFCVITLLKKRYWKKHFGNMIYTMRGPVYHKFVDVCQCDLCKKYVQKSFLSDLWCIGTKSFNNSQTSLFMNKIFIIFLLSTWLLHIMQRK